MNIELTNLPSPTKLITTMDNHRFGAGLFVATLAIIAVAAVVLAWIIFSPR
jgi:hypothetical protein